VKILSVFTFTDPVTGRQDMVVRADTDNAAFMAQVMRESGFTLVEEDGTIANV
jgi:predicted chitinase